MCVWESGSYEHENIFADGKRVAQERKQTNKHDIILFIVIYSPGTMTIPLQTSEVCYFWLRCGFNQMAADLGSFSWVEIMTLLI